MYWVLDFLSLLAIGVPGWLLFRFLKVPASIMIGAMFSAAFFTVKGWWIQEIPVGANLLLQIILGLFIGIRFTRQSGRDLKGSIWVALLAGIWWVSFPLGLGWLISEWFALDFPTSILGTVPGGIAEMSILALSLNADAALVALMQFFRLSSVLIVMPIISARINKSMNGRDVPIEGKILPEGNQTAISRVNQVRGALLTLAFATVGGVACFRLGVPVGGFVGSMALTAIASGAGLPLMPLPLIFRHFGQLGLGAMIGLNATPGTMSTLWGMLPTILGTTAAMLGWGILLAYLVKKIMKWNLMTCLLATCPGGITQISSIADELGAEPLKVSFLHLVRLCTIFIVLPPLIKVILHSYQ